VAHSDEELLQRSAILHEVSGVVSAAVSDLYADAVRKLLMKPKTLPMIPRFLNLCSRPDCHIESKAD